MTNLVWPGELEVRQEGRTIRGRFPYNVTATLQASGTVRKERFAPRAFRYSVTGAGRGAEVNLLSGHSFAAPLASRGARSLTLRDSAEALTFEARLPPEDAWPSWMLDAVLAIRSGLFAGISPGFRLPPPSAVPTAERLLREPGNEGVMIREIVEAVLFELSLVTRPAYTASSVDVRQEFAADALGGNDETGAETGDPEPDRLIERARLWL